MNKTLKSSDYLNVNIDSLKYNNKNKNKMIMIDRKIDTYVLLEK